ncbi:hypothetical protein [Alteromonas sp. a30]|uniref:hypothetical protein n=1 Tax=Alteromonas sp. a30 TaxID=2730917 RepID=UPI002281AFB5|nr:hypothetical protein [Alteromonas sp. a30]MCY7294957.1 hypothetical protein [Alteromonas sp. a30]
MIIAKMHSPENINKVANKLESMDYEIAIKDDNNFFLYGKNVSYEKLTSDVKSAKAETEFGAHLNCRYGCNLMVY